MGSQETIPANSRLTEPISGPRISFSADFLGEKSFISISPNSQAEKKEQETGKEKFKNADFEFLPSNLANESMLTADELFFEGKLLPFWQMHHSEKLNKISLKNDQQTEMGLDSGKVGVKEEPRMSWFLDDDPSPRPPKCTVLWKELLKLRKQRASTLSPSSSTSSSYSSSSSGSISDVYQIEENKNGTVHREKHMKRIKNGLDRTRSASLKLRPIVNVPVCTQAMKNATFPQFLLKKGRLVER